MNNLIIKDLFLKAKTLSENKQSDLVNTEELIYNKFAELLISECADICTNFKYSNEGPSENAAYQRSLCKFAIKEYFEISSKGPLSPKVIR